MSNKRWTVERCQLVAALYSERPATSENLYAADCWQTMGRWLEKQPTLTDKEASAVWDFICARSENGGFVWDDILAKVER